MELYHATPRANVEKILSQGLRPVSPLWPIHMSIESSYESLVAFCHDVDDADVAVLRVEVEGLTLSTGFDGPDTLTCYHPIPPSRIRLV